MTRTLSTIAAVLAAAAALGLAGCGGQEPGAAAPTASASGRYAGKPDARPWEAAASPYATGAFKAGDRAGWEAAMKTRADNQNEYLRTR